LIQTQESKLKDYTVVKNIQKQFKSQQFSKTKSSLHHLHITSGTE